MEPRTLEVSYYPDNRLPILPVGVAQMICHVANCIGDIRAVHVGQLAYRTHRLAVRFFDLCYASFS